MIAPEEAPCCLTRQGVDSFFFFFGSKNIPGVRGQSPRFDHGFPQGVILITRQADAADRG